MVYSTTLSIARVMQCRMTGQVVDWKFVEGGYHDVTYATIYGVCLKARTHNLDEIFRLGARF